jgi:hypothetical protein
LKQKPFSGQSPQGMGSQAEPGNQKRCLSHLCILVFGHILRQLQQTI